MRSEKARMEADFHVWTFRRRMCFWNDKTGQNMLVDFERMNICITFSLLSSPAQVKLKEGDPD